MFRHLFFAIIFSVFSTFKNFKLQLSSKPLVEVILNFFMPLGIPSSLQRARLTTPLSLDGVFMILSSLHRERAMHTAHPPLAWFVLQLTCDIKLIL